MVFFWVKECLIIPVCSAWKPDELLGKGKKRQNGEYERFEALGSGGRTRGGWT